jgi:tetratricopeptide (TPR) repeat protein
VRQARIAEANRQRAERRFDDVRKLAVFVLFDMHDAIVRLPGTTPARKQLVEGALQYLDRLADEGVSDPVLLAEVASGYERLSRVQGQSGRANLGDPKSALASIRKAVSLREELAAASPTDARHLTRLADSYGMLAGLLPAGEAPAVLQKMRATLDSIPAGHADDPSVLQAWEAYYAESAGGQTEDLAALRDIRARQVEVSQKLFDAEPANPDRQRSLAQAYKYHGAVLHALGERKAARLLYDKALAVDQKAVDAQPANPDAKLGLSFSHGSIGSLLRDEGDLAGAHASYQQALHLRREVYLDDPSNEFAFRSVVRAHQSLARVFAYQADLAAATHHEREVLKLRGSWEVQHASAHGQTAWEASFHRALGTHARIAAEHAPGVLRRREHWRRAREEYVKALALWHAVARRSPLAGEEAAYPKQIQDEIDKCDAALSGPEGGRPRPG